jgi:hypothetical protein
VTVYISNDDLATHLGLDPVVAAANVLLSARLTAMCTAVSRAVDVWCRRHFYAKDETRFFDVPPSIQRRPGKLLLDDDLISVDQLLDLKINTGCIR